MSRPISDVDIEAMHKDLKALLPDTVLEIKAGELKRLVQALQSARNGVPA